jgi:hypothetical protein
MITCMLGGLSLNYLCCFSLSYNPEMLVTKQQVLDFGMLQLTLGYWTKEWSKLAADGDHLNLRHHDASVHVPGCPCDMAVVPG